MNQIKNKISARIKMKIRITIASILIIISSNLLAQKHSGGYGKGFFGITFNGVPMMDSKLSEEGLFGRGAQTPVSGTVIGGGGFGFRGNGWVLGTGGFRARGFAFDNERGSIESELSMFTIQAGYIIADKGRNILFPYLGLGRGTSWLNLMNRSGHPMAIDENQIIGNNEARRYYLKSFTADLGISFMRLRYDPGHDHGGFTVGMDAGVVFHLPRSKWKYEVTDEIVNGLPATNPYRFYIRIFVGGIFRKPLPS